ncbi:MAG: SecD/SecF fusion protein [Myxococcota bacterium]|jgi:SecD/SecF fusion protein
MIHNLTRKLFGIAIFSGVAIYALFAFSLHLGLDLRGGARIVYSFDFESALEANQIDEVEYANKSEMVTQMADIFRERLDGSGLADIPIYPQGETQLVIELPDRSEEEVAEIKSTISNQGLLDFRIIANVSDDLGLDAEKQKYSDWKVANPEGLTKDFNRLSETDGGPRSEISWYIPSEKGDATTTLAGYMTSGAIPLLMLDAVHSDIASGDGSWEFAGDDLNYVGGTLDNKGMPAVAFEFSEYRKSAFGDFTEQYKNRLMAIVLNGSVYSAPKINGRLDGAGIIEGGSQGFSVDEVRSLTTVLRTGSLKVLPQLESESFVGSTLGADAIKTGTNSAMFGGILVLLFMLVYYRMNGVVACLALGFNGFLLVGAIYFSQATLTLPGLAGLVLTIGMAVDANILIFERIREEWERGREVPQAYKNGYERTFWTIIDANVTTLIAGFILYQFGTGPVQGFAATLCLGILTTLFSTLVFSKVIMHLIVFGKNPPQKVSMMAALAGKKIIDFAKGYKVAAGVSATLLVGGLLMYSQQADQMLGIDFAGGSTARVHLNQEVSIAEMRTRLNGFQVTVIKADAASTSGADTSADFQVKRKLSAADRAAGIASSKVQGGKDLAQEMVDELESSLVGLLLLDADGKVELDKSFPEKSTVGARVSGEIQGAAVRAILLALVLIVVYMNFRFHEYRFGLAAVAALFHDVLITLGVLAFVSKMGWVHVEINLEIIAAFLTIIGYSLNDTIVVFDRIRENLPRRKESFKEIINISINQSLSRTILTSVTTFFVVSVLFFANRQFHNTLEGFSFAMLVGIVVGTYSSIFVAAPLLTFFDRWARKKKIGSLSDNAKRKLEKKAATTS